MSTLLIVNHVGIPSDQKLVRSTVEGVDPEAPPAVEKDAPEFNEVERDTAPHVGLRESNLASHWIPSRQYAPGWAGTAQVTPSFALLNERQATQGLAAEREMNGEFGHGTMGYAIGLEPTIREGGAYGNDYFVADRPGIQPGMGTYMEPGPGFDRAISAAAAAQGARDAHESASSGMVSMWAGAMSPGVRHA